MSEEKPDLAAIRHPSEGSRFLITLCVLVPVAIILAIIVMATFGIALIIVPFVLFISWFSLRLFMAWYVNNTVKVTEESFPHVWHAIQEAKDLFTYPERVEAYVVEDGSYNAAVLPLLRRKYLLINSDLLKPMNNPDETRFIVGRFVGALAARHYRFMWFQVLLNGIQRLAILNVLLFPYERAVQLSGDRLGLYFIGGDTATAVRARIKSVVGSEVASQVNLASFTQQRVEAGQGFFDWLTRALSRFPHATKRVDELIAFGLEAYPEKTEPWLASIDPREPVVARPADHAGSEGYRGVTV